MAIDKPDLTRVWAKDAPSGNVVDPNTTTPGKFEEGWQAEVPPFEHFNFLQKFFSEGLAYINEQGVPEWDSETVFPVGAISKGSDGKLYGAILEQSGNDPVNDDGTNWVSGASLISMGSGETVEDSVNNRVIRAASVADVEGIESPQNGWQVRLSGGRNGIFEFDNSDLSTEVSNDPQQGIHIAPSSDPTGASGAWVRQYSGPASSRWFGAVGDGSADDAAAVQAGLDYLRYVADLGGQNIDYGVLTAINGAFRFGSNVTIPNRIVLDTSGSQIYLDASVSIIFGQTAVLYSPSTRIRMAAGHTGAAIKKDSSVGAIRVFGYPFIFGPEDDDQTSSTTGSIGVDMTRCRYSQIQVHVSGVVRGIYANADDGKTCYYNNVECWIENTNYGIYTLGALFNGNKFNIFRNSSNYQTIFCGPGVDSSAASDNEFNGTFFENVVNVGVALNGATGNSFYNIVIEGLAGAEVGYKLDGNCADNKFYDCRVGGELGRADLFSQSSGTTNTSFYGTPFGDLINITGSFSPTLSGDGGTVVNGGSTQYKVASGAQGPDINVDAIDYVFLQNSAGATLENFTQTTLTGYGREITVYFDGNTEVVETGNIRLSGAARTPPAGNIIKFFNPGSSVSNNFFEVYTS